MDVRVRISSETVAKCARVFVPVCGLSFRILTCSRLGFGEPSVDALYISHQRDRS